MATTEYIKRIISDNKNDIAFIIGNGIHNYFSHKDDDYNCMSWSDLLKYLWKTFAKNKQYPSFISCQYSNGISNTEFFNLLEIEFLSNYHVEENSFKPLLTQPINIEYYNKLKEFHHSSEAFEPLSKQNSDIKLNRSILFSDEINKAHTNLINIAYRDLGIKNDNYIDRINNIITAINNKAILMDLSEPIKREIARKMGEYKAVPGINKIVQFIKGINAPILTTNYDTVLSKSIGICDNEIISITDDIDSNWSSYYGEKIESPLMGFGIWHIHGIYNDHKSVSIGTSDYMNNIHKALMFLPDNIAISHLENSDWRGSNTWLSIIFNKSLFMFGLKLDLDETFIRWLLIMRYKYMVIRGKLKKSWYITKSSENIPCAKRYFLESVGFEIVDIPNWDILYEKVWE